MIILKTSLLRMDIKKDAMNWYRSPGSNSTKRCIIFYRSENIEEIWPSLRNDQCSIPKTKQKSRHKFMRRCFIKNGTFPCHWLINIYILKKKNLFAIQPLEVSKDIHRCHFWQQGFHFILINSVYFTSHTDR